MELMEKENLKALVRNIPDFPEQGVQFKDITPLLRNEVAFASAIEGMAGLVDTKSFDVVASVEARGFILGSALAYSLRKGFVPIRKPGKLPRSAVRAALEKEYGKDAIEMHADAISKGDRVLIVDDVLATGGTISSAIELVEKCGGSVEGLLFLLELSYLNGRKNIRGLKRNYPVHSLIQF